MLFADRAEANGRRPVLLSLWRNGLLLAIGLLHGLLWVGDVLVAYALCVPLLLVARKRSPRTFGDYWFIDGGPASDNVEIFWLSDYFVRAARMMLIGVALYRTGIIHGQRSVAFYRNMTICGLLTGLPIATAGLMANRERVVTGHRTHR